MTVKSMAVGPMQANCHVAIDEESGNAFIVDLGECTEELISVLSDEKIKKICYVLLTHGHFDHISGVARFKKLYPDVPVVINEADAPCLGDDLLSMARGFGCSSQEKSKADILLHGDCELPFGDKKIKVIHTPGHSKGGVVYIIDDCMFSGDTLFRITIGRTDLPGGSYEEMTDSINKLFDLPGDYKVYTGHNISTTLDTERRENRFVRRGRRK